MRRPVCLVRPFRTTTLPCPSHLCPGHRSGLCPVRPPRRILGAYACAWAMAWAMAEREQEQEKGKEKKRIRAQGRGWDKGKGKGKGKGTDKGLRG